MVMSSRLAALKRKSSTDTGSGQEWRSEEKFEGRKACDKLRVCELPKFRVWRSYPCLLLELQSLAATQQA